MAWPHPLLPQWPPGLGCLRRDGHPFPIALGSDKGASLDTHIMVLATFDPWSWKVERNERVQAGYRGTY